MPTQRYGITFPFRDSVEGFFLRLNTTPEDEIRTNITHLLLTRKGARFFLPDFGTKLLSFLFEPLDESTKQSIEGDIRDAIKKYIPGLTVNEISIVTYDEVLSLEKTGQVENTIQSENNSFSFTSEGERPYTIRIRIDYTINTNNVFQQKDFIILNI